MHIWAWANELGKFLKWNITDNVDKILHEYFFAMSFEYSLMDMDGDTGGDGCLFLVKIIL